MFIMFVFLLLGWWGLLMVGWGGGLWFLKKLLRVWIIFGLIEEDGVDLCERRLRILDFNGRFFLSIWEIMICCFVWYMINIFLLGVVGVVEVVVKFCIFINFCVE